MRSQVLLAADADHLDPDLVRRAGADNPLGAVPEARSGAGLIESAAFARRSQMALITHRIAFYDMHL